MTTTCGCARCYGGKFPIMHLCADCGNKRCPRATWHGYQCNNSNEPMQEAITEGLAGVDDDIEKIKMEPHAFFNSLPRPERLRDERKRHHRVAAWLLRMSERIESVAYMFDDRAWARPRYGVVQATLDTEPLQARIARLEGRPPAPLPMDDDGYMPDGRHWREAA